MYKMRCDPVATHGHLTSYKKINIKMRILGLGFYVPNGELLAEMGI
jgi:hypothetical protein